jgi:hypothetical protein
MPARNKPRSKPSTRQACDVLARARTGGRRTTLLWVGAGVLVTAALVAVLIVGIAGHTRTHTSDGASPSLK